MPPPWTGVGVDVDLSPIVEHLPALARGFRLTIELSATAWIVSCLLGAAMTAVRHAGPAWITRSVRIYIDIMRGMPSLVLILACFYLLPATGLRLGPVQSGLVALSLYYAAYFSEVMRGALAMTPPGQWEAGMTVGLAPARILARIVLPQALSPMMPPLAGLTIGLVKETALLSAISVGEFVFAGKEAISDSYAPFEIYAFLALCYWALNGAIAFLFGRFELGLVSHRRPLEVHP